MYPTPPNDINDAIQNGVSMMSKRPIEMMIMGRMVRVYPQSAGNLSVWIDNGNHGFTQVPGLVLHSPATSNSEALYRVSGLRPGNSEISTERNLLEMLVRDYLRVTGQDREAIKVSSAPPVVDPIQVSADLSVRWCSASLYRSGGR